MNPASDNGASSMGSFARGSTATSSTTSLASSLGQSHASNGPPIGNIKFVGRGRGSKFCKVDQSFIHETFKEDLLEELIKELIGPLPEVLISVTGSAEDFSMRSSKLEQIFSRGIRKAAQVSKAWIVTGGSDCGVMKRVGEAIRGHDKCAMVPCIGIASYKKVTNKEILEVTDADVDYSPDEGNTDDSAALNPDHTHFILVDSPNNNWGQEIKFRTEFEDHITKNKKVPLVLVAVNGGPGTVETVIEGVARDFPIVIVDGSGRASDGMAAYIKNSYKGEVEAWNSFIEASSLPEEKLSRFRADITKLSHSERITIFNPNESETEDMDKTILRSIFSFDLYSSFADKLKLGVKWARVDLVDELLRQYEKTPPESKTSALSASLLDSLLDDLPEVCGLLLSKGARVEELDLSILYKSIEPQLKHLGGLAGVYISKQDAANNSAVTSLEGVLATDGVVVRDSRPQQDPNENTPLKAKENSSVSPRTGNKEKVSSAAGKILRAINPMYANVLNDNRVTTLDILTWAVLADHFELAKNIWRSSDYPVHSALIVCRLYQRLDDWFRYEPYKEQYKWFEQEAVKVIMQLKYENAVKVLEFKWEEVGHLDALSLAETAECKEFFSIPLVQRNFDEKFYSKPEANAHILLGTGIWQVIVMLIFPFTIPMFESYLPIEEAKSSPSIRHFYQIPLVKLLTSTISYVIFMAFLLANLLMIEPAPTNSSRFDVMWYELVLWTFFITTLVEEIMQFCKDYRQYFSLISNRMDACLHALLLTYLILRVLAWSWRSQDLLTAYTDVLVIATIVCFIRFMNVFAVSKALGPLFFVIVRLFYDVAQWLFIFLLFMVSFQAGIFAFTRQVGQPGWLFFPAGSMGTGFTAILGDLGDNTMEWMSTTRVGVLLVLVYSLITQVMLVNLLIAMMGNTYTTVKDNSDKEWKFNRKRLLADYMTSSAVPPPFNILIIFYLVIQKVQSCLSRDDKKQLERTSEMKMKTKVTAKALKRMQREEEFNKKRQEEEYSKLLAIVKDAKDIVIEDEEINARVAGAVREQMRLLLTKRDSDRAYLEARIESIERSVGAILRILQGSSVPATPTSTASFIPLTLPVRSSSSSHPSAPPPSPALSTSQHLPSPPTPGSSSSSSPPSPASTSR